MDLNFTDEYNEILVSEFGEDAILNTAAAGESIIRVLFSKNYMASEVMNVRWDSTLPVAECRISDISQAVQNDTLTVKNITYRIDHIESDETGWSKLVLFKVNA